MNVGDVFETNYWGRAEVVELLNGRNIVVRFVNTGNLKNTRTTEIVIGAVKDTKAAKGGILPTTQYLSSKRDASFIKAGTLYSSNLYGVMEVIEYRGSKDIQIKFVNTGNELSTQKYALDTGQVHDVVLRGALAAEKSLLAEAASVAYWDERAALLKRNRSRDVEAVQLKEVERLKKFTDEASKRVGQRVVDKMGEAFIVTGMVHKGLWKITYEVTGNAYEISETIVETLYGMYDTNQPDFDKVMKEHTAKINAMGYEKNRDHRIALASAYQRNNLERTRERNRRSALNRSCASGSHTQKEKADLLTLQGGLCKCCGYDLSMGKHIDHIMPIILGGRDDIENMQYLCQVCNSVKADRHPDDWAAYSISEDYKDRLAARRSEN